MGIDPVTATIGAAVLGAVTSGIQGARQADAAKDAGRQQQAASEKLYNQQERENNRANARGPDVNALFAQNELEGQQGASGTMLTGPMGVDPNSLSLGKNTVLGGA